MIIVDRTDHTRVVRPTRSKTDAIIIHRISDVVRWNPNEPRTVEDIISFFLNEPWGVAPTLLSSSSVADAVRDWTRFGIPDHILRKAFVPYTYLVDFQGTVTRCLPEDARGAHAGRVNWRSIGIGVVGDFRSHVPTNEQLLSVKYLVRDLMHRHGVRKVQGHDEVRTTPKSCPGILFPLQEVRDWAWSAVRTMETPDRW